MELPEYVASAIESLSSDGEMKFDRKWWPQFNENKQSSNQENALMAL